MTTVRPYPVAVIGGGPVGLTLAMDLASRGIETLVLEQREPFEPPEPRCNHVSARTMEIFRRLGLAGKVRDAGLPADYPHDVAYATSFAGYELGRVRIPSRAHRFNDEGYADGGWPTPEPPHRINQTYLEPVMHRHALGFGELTLRCNIRVDGLEQHEGFVRVSGTDLQTQQPVSFDAQYVVGCDGARSTVRQSQGIKLQGEALIMQAVTVAITAPDLASRATMPPAWMYFIFNPKQSGNVIALDGKEKWVVNPFLPKGTREEDVDVPAAVRALLGTDVDFTITHQKFWNGRRLVADRFVSGRVFIAGDAAHSWPPMGGYAMNAGIADAANLAWKLAAVLHGWADEKLLQTYQTERQPVLEQVSKLVSGVRRRNDITVPAEIEEASGAGRKARAEVGAYFMEYDAPQFACIGMNFGYFYVDSPAIVYDGAEPPGYTLKDYTPSTCPGCRAPHLWVEEGASLYDRLSPGFTLMRLDRTIDVSPLERAAAACAVPLQVLDLDPRFDPERRYDFPLVLIRPDQHVAWRGTQLPPDAAWLIDKIRGACGT